MSNELGRVAQENNKVKGNDTLDFIHKHEVPVNKTVKYSNFNYDFYKLKKEEKVKESHQKEIIEKKRKKVRRLFFEIETPKHVKKCFRF